MKQIQTTTMKVLLISEETIKKETPINDNVEMNGITSAIETSQDIYLQELIGTKLYNRICDMVADGSITSNPDYKELLDDYILPYLRFSVLSEVIIPLTFKYRNQGLVNAQDTYISQPSLKDAQTIEQFYSNRAQFYSTRLTKHLHANHSKYPEFCKKDNCDDIRGHNNLNDACNIFLG